MGFGHGFGHPLRPSWGLGSSWTPAELGNDVHLWLKPESLVAGLVTQWDDSSPYGNHCTQTVTASKPLATVNQLDGYTGAVLDGIDDFLHVPSLNSGTASSWEIFFVTDGSGPATPSFFEADESTGRLIIENKSVTGSPFWAFYEGSAWTEYTQIAQAYQLVDFSLNTAAASKLYVNGVEKAISAVGTGDGSFTAANIGGVNTALGSRNGSRFWPEPIIEVLILPAILPAEPDQKRTNIESYFARKYATLGMTP